MEQDAPKQSDFTRMMSPEELADGLGMARNTIYEHLKRQEIPGAKKLGAKWIIWGPAVLAWFLSGQAPSQKRRAK
jgi:predicted DNA-binding transcriptional regulator AlpA